MLLATLLAGTLAAASMLTHSTNAPQPIQHVQYRAPYGWGPYGNDRYDRPPPRDWDQPYGDPDIYHPREWQDNRDYRWYHRSYRNRWPYRPWGY